MLLKVTLSSKTFLTVGAWIELSHIMCLFVTLQMIFPSKAFVTHCTKIRSWLAIVWMLSDHITISFNRHLKWTFTCKQNQDSQNNWVMLKKIKVWIIVLKLSYLRRSTAVNQYLAVGLCYLSTSLPEYSARSLTWMVTTGLASHWPCLTDSVVYSPTGSMATEREMSTLPTPLCHRLSL